MILHVRDLTETDLTTISLYLGAPKAATTTLHKLENLRQTPSNRSIMAEEPTAEPRGAMGNGYYFQWAILEQGEGLEPTVTGSYVTSQSSSGQMPQVSL